MRLWRATKHENSIKGDRKGRPYLYRFFICKDRTLFCPCWIPACAGMTPKKRVLLMELNTIFRIELSHFNKVKLSHPC